MGEEICARDDFCTDRKTYTALIIVFFLLLATSLGIMGYVVKNNPELDQRQWTEISVFPRCQIMPWNQTSNIEHFFDNEGILIYGIRTSERQTCDMCNCSSPNKIEVLIKKDDYLKVANILQREINKANQA